MSWWAHRVHEEYKGYTIVWRDAPAHYAIMDEGDPALWRSATELGVIKWIIDGLPNIQPPPTPPDVPVTPFAWATTGAWEGETVHYMKDYRGYKIYSLSLGGGQYRLIDPDGYELSAVFSIPQQVYDWIDAGLGPVEPPPEEPPTPPIYTCPYCGATFSTSETLTRHVEQQHPPVEPPPEEPPVVDPNLKTLFQTYRDIDIYKFTATGWFFWTIEGVDYTLQYWNPTIAKIDETLGAAIGPDEYVTTWGGYGIWKRLIDNKFYVMVEGLPQGEFDFLEQAQEYVENVLGADPEAPVITPGPDPDYTPMDKDPTRAAAISKPVNDFLTSVGLTEEALEAIRGSGADPEKAATFAKAISKAAVGGIAILGTIGIVSEIATLGQVEGVLGTIGMTLEASGIADLLTKMFELPFKSALLKPSEHYWNSVYTPEISGLSQLTRELVREVIDLDTYISEAAMQGLSEERATRIYDAHWRELGIRDTDIILHRGGMLEEEWEKYRVIQDYRPTPRPGFEFSDLDMSKVLRKTILGRVDTRRAYQYGYMERPDLIKMYEFQGYEDDAELQADIQIRASVDGLQSAIRRNSGMIFRDQLKDAREDESAAVSSILRERDAEIVVITLRWNIEEISEIDLMLIPDEYKDRAVALGPITEEEAAILEADIRKKADVEIAKVRALARAREEEVEIVYRAALVEVNDLIDPDDLWVLRYKLEAARVEVEAEFEIEPGTLVQETAEEPA